MNKEKILEKIEELKKEREAFLAQVNQIIGEFKGRIETLEELLEEEE